MHWRNGLFLAAGCLWTPGSAAAQPPQLQHTPEPPLADGDVRQAQFTIGDTPVVTVTITAPSFVPNGKDVEYKLRAENSTSRTAGKVELIHPLPPNVTIVSVEPKETERQGTELIWKLGNLAPNEKKEVSLKVRLPNDATEFSPRADVRYQHGRIAKVKIAKPELAAKILSDKSVQQYDVIPIRLEVSNPGMLEVKEIQVIEQLPDGLSHVYDGPPGQKQPADDAHKRTWTIPRLAPSEVRYLDFRVSAEKVGTATHVATASSANGGQVDAKSELAVQAAKLEITVDGPPKRVAHAPAVYRVTVRNGGTHAMRNVTVTGQMPKEAQLVSVTDNVPQFESVVQWIVAQLAPGESRVFELSARVPLGGRATFVFTAAYRGFRQSAEAVTEFETAPAVKVSLTGNSVAVGVNGTVRYTIAIENAGSAPATNVRATLKLPDELAFANAEPANHRADSNQVVFEPRNVPAGGRETLVVTARGVKPGVAAAVVLELFADHLQSGALRQQENTTVTAGASAK